MQIGLDFDIRHHFELGDQFDESRGSRWSEHGPQYADECLAQTGEQTKEAHSAKAIDCLFTRLPPRWPVSAWATQETCRETVPLCLKIMVEFFLLSSAFREPISFASGLDVCLRHKADTMTARSVMSAFGIKADIR
jgi:hypothetical protein